MFKGDLERFKKIQAKLMMHDSVEYMNESFTDPRDSCDGTVTSFKYSAGSAKEDMNFLLELASTYLILNNKEIK